MLTRRRFAQIATVTALVPSLPRFSYALTREALAALESSGLAYISPLRSDGSESKCHGEIWFSWLDEKVVVITAPKRWRASAVSKGLDKARIWAGDHGRRDRIIGSNETFRKAPHFDAKAVLSKDRGLFDRLMKDFTRKYPKEFPKWDQKMHDGFASGDRVLALYTPL